MSIPFPYEPYPQQRALMDAIYATIDSGDIGYFESPTGTGKSLSLLCAALQWQFNKEKQIFAKLAMKIAEDIASSKPKATEVDWLSSFTSNYQSKMHGDEGNDYKKGYELYMNTLQRINEIIKSRKSGMKDKLVSKTSKATIPIKKKTTYTNEIHYDDEMDEFSLGHYDSDDDVKTVKGNKINVADGYDSDNDVVGEDASFVDTLELPQIIYCSRTHSQIAQFVGEIKKTNFTNIRCVTLGSRKNLCINESVKTLRNDATMSEKCLEMQKTKSKSTGKVQQNDKNEENIVKVSTDKKKQKTGAKKHESCIYHNKAKEKLYADYAFSSIADIEDLVTLGMELQTCPYYATRNAVKTAQLICMPYNLLLNNELRESLGLNLKGRIIVFDEAHNLVEAINQTYSAELSLQQIKVAIDAITMYISRFHTLLSGKNNYYINLLASVLKSVQKCLIDATSINASQTQTGIRTVGSDKKETVMMTINDFVFKSRLDNVNLFKLRRHIIETHLVNKIGGFVEAMTAKVRAEEAKLRSNPIPSACSGCLSTETLENEYPTNVVSSLGALRSALSLLTCLTIADSDGRIVCTVANAPDTSPTLKFILFNPSTHFKSIAQDARSLLLLGGTMQPFSFFTTSLFPYMDESKIRKFTCGHVISRSSVQPIIVTTGPSGKMLEFTFDKRLNNDITDELHNAILTVISTVPNGVVIFFTSYSYMETILKRWKDPMCKKLEQLAMIKSIFIEPRSASDAENVWNDYSNAAIRDDKGALLFCVMGGKLSEGINFSDKLARGVIVIGMPYPDKRDPILQEKLKFADLREPGSGNLLYEAMCMKAVNQSIGRSIRHINDYAAIVLMDKRYSQARIITQLPQWMAESINHNSVSFRDNVNLLQKFFVSNDK